MEETRKIKGYKAPFDMEYSGTKKGNLFIKDIGNSLRYCHGCFVLPKEIVETWEPEYEESVEEKLKYILDLYHGEQILENDCIEQIKSLFTNNK